MTSPISSRWAIKPKQTFPVPMTAYWDPNELRVLRELSDMGMDDILTSGILFRRMQLHKVEKAKILERAREAEKWPMPGPHGVAI